MLAVFPLFETRPRPTVNCTVITSEFVERRRLPPQTGQPPVSGKVSTLLPETLLVQRPSLGVAKAITYAAKAATMKPEKRCLEMKDFLILIGRDQTLGSVAIMLTAGHFTKSFFLGLHPYTDSRSRESVEELSLRWQSAPSEYGENV